jgi:RNA polymerase sigma factor (sigma-70 family)
MHHDGSVGGAVLAIQPDEFVILVREHSAAVHGYLARRAGRQDADDLLAEVWLRAFRSRHSYDAEWADPRPWLYGIARNTLRAHWRSTAARRGPHFARVDDLWSDVDERLDAQRMAPELARGLAKLNPDDREILLLVAWEELAPADIALALGLPQGTVRSRLHRARHLLQDHLDAVDSAVEPHRESAEA